jgi:hypothetical protein
MKTIFYFGSIHPDNKQLKVVENFPFKLSIGDMVSVSYMGAMPVREVIISVDQSIQLVAI